MIKRRHIIISLLVIFLMTHTMLTPLSAVAEASSYADGEHTLPFEVLKDTTDEISATSEYIVSPAKLLIENGKMRVMVTLNNSSWWQSFEIQTPAGAYEQVTVLSENSDNNTRIVAFHLDDLTPLLQAKIHIIVTGIPGFDYDNTYDIRFKFDGSHLPRLAELEDDAANEVVIEKDIVVKNEQVEDEQIVVEEEIITEDELELGVSDSESIQHQDVVIDQSDEQMEEQAKADETNADIIPGDTVDNEATEDSKDSKDEKDNNIMLFLSVALALIIIIIVIVLMRNRK